MYFSRLCQVHKYFAVKLMTASALEQNHDIIKVKSAKSLKLF